MTRLFCHVHVLPKKRRSFGVWSIFAFIIKRIFPCSFGNKRMHLLTRVYGIATIKVVLRAENGTQVNNMQWVLQATW